MATLGDINFSLRGESQQASSLAEDSIVNSIRGGHDAETQSEWHLFKLVNNNRKGGVYIPNVDYVINPATITKENPKGSVEMIRLLVGVSSIWAKDQKDLTPEYIRRNGRSLSFPRGTKILRIADYDTAALEFARLCNHNIGSKSKTTGSRFEFYEYDPAREEKEAFERESFALEQALEAKMQKEGDMRKHANFLGIRLINDLGLPKSEEGIRREYVMYANKNPQYFKQTLGTPQVEIAYMVRMAIVDAKIEIGREQGKIFWANGGGMICVCPKTIEPSQYLIELALTNSDEGKKFKEQLQKVTTK